MLKILKNNWILILILISGALLRAWHPLQLFQYSHDQDLAGWFIRDVLVSHHFRLIGQETSSHGIFIGPYFYYLLIPFYLLTKMDPAGTLLLSIILGTFAIFSIYYVFLKISTKNTALIGALVYSLSVLIIFTDREVDPTQPVMLWTIWFLFAIWKILKGKRGGYLIIGLLVGVIWSINLQLVIVLPLILLAQIFSGKKINLKELIIGILIAIILNIPFAAFEVRHGFQQTKALFSSLTTNKDYVTGTATGFLPKLDRTMQLVYKNTTNIFGLNVLNIDARLMFWVLIFSGAFLVLKKKIDKKLGLILFLWLGIYILFFTKVSLNLSEYYLNGMNVIYIAIASLVISSEVEKSLKKSDSSTRLHLVGMTAGYLLIGVFVLLNLYSFFTRPVNANGYNQRKAIIAYIKEDAKTNGYPCVSLSFITSPGNNLGYRYFTWELGLKTKPVSNQIPVYSIVFPLSMVDKFDKSFGALGLVLPNYKRYNKGEIQKACAGEDFTISEPMFGFTK